MTIFDTARRQAHALSQTSHRPWPLPSSPWLMGQSWLDLAFFHWPVEPDALRAHLPPGLSLDTFAGRAWLGVTPFRLEGLRLRGLPPVPFLSDFLELNVRTYVTAGDKPGIWFFSLDASRRAAVVAARRVYRLPYFHAEISLARSGDEYGVRSRRHDSRSREAELLASYRPGGEPGAAPEGTLEYFLVERYCLYARDRDKLFRAEIHHPPWPLQNADGTVEASSVLPSQVASAEPPVVHYSARQDVLIWPLESV